MVVLQNNEKVKTNLLYMTSSDTPRTLTDETQGTSITRINTLVSEDLPLTDLMANQRDRILTGIQIQEFERKDKMSTKVIDETTLRNHFPKASNADAFARGKSTTSSSISAISNTSTDTKVKEAINIQGFSCY